MESHIYENQGRAQDNDYSLSYETLKVEDSVVKPPPARRPAAPARDVQKTRPAPGGHSTHHRLLVVIAALLILTVVILCAVLGISILNMTRKKTCLSTYDTVQLLQELQANLTAQNNLLENTVSENQKSLNKLLRAGTEKHKQDGEVDVAGLNSTIRNVNKQISELYVLMQEVKVKVFQHHPNFVSFSQKASNELEKITDVISKINDTNSQDYTLRLVCDTSTTSRCGQNRGRLEMYEWSTGSWGTICDDSFETNDANVACRQLGYASGTAKESAYFGQGTGDIVLDNLGCTGRDRALIHCPHAGWKQNNCNHGEDVGVICT